MKQIKICFVGKMRSGKSEAVNYMLEKFKGEVEVVDFGDALKEVVNSLHPEKRGVKDRAKLQEIGQYMRKLDEDIWINPVKHKIENTDKKIIVCASCRQKNEYDFLNKIGFLFVRVSCLDSLRVRRAENSGDKFNLKDFVHETEMGIDDFECELEIVNDWSKDKFYSNIDSVVNYLINKHVKEGKQIGDNNFKF